MKVSTAYLSHPGGLNGAVPKIISSEDSTYMSAITGINGEPIAKPYSCWNNVICTQNVNISISLSIEMLVRYPNEGPDSNQFRTTDEAMSVVILVNRLTTV